MRTKKTTIPVGLLLFSLLFLFTFCDKKTNETALDAAEVSINDFSHSGCEGNTAGSRSESTELPEELNIKLIENELLFEHSNAVFNCCPGKLSATVETEKGKLIIEEKEEQKGCKCNCFYTLKYKLSPIKEGTYTVNIKGYEPFQLKVESGLNVTIVLKKI